MLVILLIHLTLNYIGCLKSQERFSGGLLGVSADVVLFTESNHASIKLSGIPLGGSLAGVARFHELGGSTVEIDEPLNSQLQRRFVEIKSARFDSDEDRVYVIVKLPLFIGTRTIVLNRCSRASCDASYSGPDSVF
jgi:hypothetical protein